MYDLIIVGGGPAGAAAAIYAARKQLKTLFLTMEWGGQSTVSTEIQNWVGTPKISGAELAANLRKHVEEYKGEFLEVRSPAEATGLKTFDHQGLTYCASCDGPLFAGQDVVVVGGGNAAFETSLQLLAYCKTVTLVN